MYEYKDSKTGCCCCWDSYKGVIVLCCLQGFILIWMTIANIVEDLEGPMYFYACNVVSALMFLPYFWVYK